jgi:hypothetical protein
MTANHPDKQLVRDLMAQRRESREPPPTPEEIRRKLGWGLVKAERDTTNRNKR